MGIGDGIMHSNIKGGFGADQTPSSSAAKLGGQESSNHSPPAPPIEKHLSAVEKAASLIDEVN